MTATVHFASDNYASVHPEVMAAIDAAREQIRTDALAVPRVAFVEGEPGVR